MIRLILLAIASAPLSLLTGWQLGICTKVSDGDGLKIKVLFGTINCRLAEIDAPETASFFEPQPYGGKAKEELEWLVLSKKKSLFAKGFHRYPSNIVWFKIVQKDSRYNRSVCKVGCLQCWDINYEMVKRGAAWAYTKWAYVSESRRRSLIRAQEKAQRKRLGLWQYANPIEPEIWRKTRKK